MVLSGLLLVAITAPRPAPVAKPTPPRAVESARPPAPPEKPAPVPSPPVERKPEPAPPRNVISSVAVPEPQIQGEVRPQTASAFGQAIGAEVAKLQGVRVITAADLRDLLALERQKELLGCADENTCLAEVVGAINADEMLTVRVSAVDTTETVTVTRLNARSSSTIHSATRAIERGGGEELLALVGPLVAAVYPDVPLRQGRSRGVDTATLRRLIPPPLPKGVFIITASLAVACAGVAAVAGLQMRGSEAEYNRLTTEGVSAPVDGDLLKRFEQQALTSATVANVLFISAGALAIASGVMAFLTDWNGPEAVAFVPTRDGAAFVWAGRF